MNKYYVVDRIEGEKIVLETFDGNIVNVNKSLINGNIKEGDLLYKKDKFYFYDKEATIKRKNIISDLTKGIWN